MRVKIYQINPDKDKNNVKFMSHGYAESHGGVDPSAYKCVFAGDMEAIVRVMTTVSISSVIGFP